MTPGGNGSPASVAPSANGGGGPIGATRPARGGDNRNGRAVQYCTFEVIDLLVGIDVRRVQEVLPEQQMAPVPLATGDVFGLINLRGRIVTALDLRTRLGLPPRPPGVRAMNAVVRRADEVVSLLVDRTRDVVEPFDDQFEPVPPTVPGNIRRLCTGTFKLEGRLLLVLDVDQVLQTSEETAAFKYPDWVAGLDTDDVLRRNGN